MNYTPLRKGHAPDIVVSRRILSACVLLASLGIAIVQMSMLAQVWHLSSHAFPPALVAGAWLAGGVLSFRFPSSLKCWGWAFVGGVLAWLAVSSASARLAVRLPLPPSAAAFGAISVTSLALGFTGTAWLAQTRPWPEIGERVVLARLVLSGTFGLVCAWNLAPSFLVRAGGLALLIPLLALDAWPQSRSPLPVRGGRVESFLIRTRGAGVGRVRLDRSALPRGWCWSYLSRRGRLPLTLIASGIAIVLGGVWNSVPTAFAGGLAQTHHLATLWWLIGAQACAFACGTALLLIPARGIIGPRARILPGDWHAPARSLTLLCLLIMGCGLAGLGLPWFQAPPVLGVCLGWYTLSALLWGVFLPRLRPTITSLITSQRHLFQEASHLPRLLPSEQAMEDHAHRVVLMAEGVLTAIGVPVFGWLIDRTGVDQLLVLSGLVLVSVACLTAVAFGREKPAGQYFPFQPDGGKGEILAERVTPATGTESG